MGATATTADHIRRAVQSPKERPTLSDLEGMSSRFEPFYEELEQGVAEVHEGQESRLAAIEGWLERVQRSLVTEQQRRLEMFRLVESNLQAQFDSMSSTWERQLEELKPDIPARLGTWHARLAVAEEDIATEREARASVIAREKARLLKQVEDFQRRLEVAKVERLESEASILKRIVDETEGSGRLIEEERSRREATLGHLRDENDEVARVSEVPNRRFKEQILDRVASATSDIKKQTLQRQAAERQFVEALESYTVALQGGLALTNWRSAGGAE